MGFGRYKLDPQDLDLSERDFLAEKNLGGVEIACSYKRSSQWGVISGYCSAHPEKCPVWLLFMDLEIRQVRGKLDYATFSLDFSSDNPQPGHGVLVTDHYKPCSEQGPVNQRTVHRERNFNPNAPTPLGSVSLGSISSTSDEKIERNWQFFGATSKSRVSNDSLPRCINWTIKEAGGEANRNVRLSWELGVAVRHDGNGPFLIRPDISGRLHGADRIFKFWPRDKIQPRRVECTTAETDLTNNVKLLLPVLPRVNVLSTGSQLNAIQESSSSSTGPPAMV